MATALCSICASALPLDVRMPDVLHIVDKRDRNFILEATAVSLNGASAKRKRLRGNRHTNELGKINK